MNAIVAIGLLKKATKNIPDFKNDNAENVELDIVDDNGNVLVRFEEGHIKTKNFDSSSYDI